MGGLPCLMSMFVFLRGSASSCCSEEQEPVMLPLVTSRNLTPKGPGFISDTLLALRSFGTTLKKSCVVHGMQVLGHYCSYNCFYNAYIWERCIKNKIILPAYNTELFSCCFSKCLLQNKWLIVLFLK